MDGESDGRVTVQRMQPYQARKTYVCPGCNQDIPPGLGHLVIVPEQAIWPQGRDSFVYKVVDGKAVLTKIDIGNRRPGEVEVAKGLVAGDVVVTDGQMKIKDGAPVMVLPSAPPPAPAVAGPTSAPKAGG